MDYLANFSIDIGVHNLCPKLRQVIREPVLYPLESGVYFFVYKPDLFFYLFEAL